MSDEMNQNCECSHPAHEGAKCSGTKEDGTPCTCDKSAASTEAPAAEASQQ